MKPEPLKDKVLWIDKVRVETKEVDTPLLWSPNYFKAFDKGSVRLAVEWLKEEIREMSLIKISNPTDEVLKKIEGAFPDICSYTSTSRKVKQ